MKYFDIYGYGGNANPFWYSGVVDCIYNISFRIYYVYPKVKNRIVLDEFNDKICKEYGLLSCSSFWPHNIKLFSVSEVDIRKIFSFYFDRDLSKLNLSFVYKDVSFSFHFFTFYAHFLIPIPFSRILGEVSSNGDGSYKYIIYEFDEGYLTFNFDRSFSYCFNLDILDGIKELLGG